MNIFDSGRVATGYAQAKTGESFLRIGVGNVEKPDEAAYRETNLYKIVEPGTWHIEQKPGWVRFTQHVPVRRGYGYIYSKTVFLSAGKPEMILVKELKNTGSAEIDTTVFNHGFFQIDRVPAGPGLVWTFPFPPKTPGGFDGMAEILGHEITYLREIGPGERLIAPLQGYGISAADHGFTLQNLKTGAGVRIAGDRPITTLTFWSPSFT